MSWHALKAEILQVDKALLRGLAAPATSDQLSELETTIGCELPANFKAAWGEHNGPVMIEVEGGWSSMELFSYFEFLTTEQIAGEWKCVQKFCTERSKAETEGPVKSQGGGQGGRPPKGATNSDRSDAGSQERRRQNDERAGRIRARMMENTATTLRTAFEQLSDTQKLDATRVLNDAGHQAPES